MAEASVFIVEDELIEAEDIRTTLVQLGYSVAGNVRSGELALESLGTANPDIVLMDIHLAGTMDGIETAARIRDLFRLPVIFLTAHADDESLRRAKVTEPYGYILKPFDERELHSAIEMALYKHRQEQIIEEQASVITILANAIADPLVLLDGGREVIALNDAMSLHRHRGLLADTAGGAEMHRIQGISSILQTQIDKAEKTGRSHVVEEAYGEKWYEIVISPVAGSGPGRTNPWFLLHFHDITDRKRLEDQVRREGIARLEHNMEQFQILNDQIRNPLQAITGYVTLDSAGFRDKILAQVRIIDDLVHQLDQGWVESEKVRKFLLRHYDAGEQKDGGGP